MSRTYGNPHIHGLDLSKAPLQAYSNEATEVARKMDNVINELECAVERLQKSICSIESRLLPISTVSKTAEPIAGSAPYPAASPLVEALRRITDKIATEADHVRRVEDILDI